MYKYTVRNSITLPNDNLIGLIKLEDTDNFIILDRLPNKLKDIVSVSKDETKSISSLTTGSRSGSAGGFVHKESNSSSLSKVTQKTNSILVSSKSSVSSICVYENDNGETKKFSSVYNDIFMNRISSASKYKMLMSSLSFRTISIHEMLSRLQSFIIVKQLKLKVDVSEDIFDNINKVINNSKTSLVVKKFMELGHGYFESVLLAWSCSSGEMRNHTSVHAHCDGNKHHPIETLTLFARMPPSSKPTNEDKSMYFHDGYLYLPIDGIIIKYKVGIHALHSNLKDTIHVPDHSRETKNWSKVNGP
jgi:hypothetical protein